METYYDNYTQAEAAMGWPKRKLKLAKKLGADGFRGNRVRPEQLLAWYAVPDNAQKLDNAFNLKNKALNSNRTIEEVKLSIAEKDEKLKDLEIIKRQGEFLTPEDVGDFLLRLRLSFESTIKGFIIELPPKFVGKSQAEIEYELNNQVSILLSTFSQQIKAKMKDM